MSLVAGLLSVQTADTDDLVGEWQQHVTVRHAKGIGNGAVLFALMSMLRKEGADSVEYNWFERDPVRNDFYSNAGFNDSVTTLTFDDAAAGAVWQGLALNTILENSRTGEYVRVTADPTTANVTVERAHAGTAAAAILDNDLWTRLFVSAEEGALPTRAVYENPEELKNYVETFNSSVFLTNAYKSDGTLRTDQEGPLRERRLYALEKISGDIEKAFLLGRRNRLAGTNGYIYQTGGIRDALTRASLTSNVLNGLTTTGVTLDVFKAWLRSFMVYGSNGKIALCGPLAYGAISDFANSATNGFRIMNSETVFGMNITTIVTPFGILELTFHPLLQEMTAYQDSMFVIDTAQVVQKTMEPLFLERNIQTRGQDAYQEQFRAKLGIKLKFAQAFGYAYGFRKILPNA